MHYDLGQYEKSKEYELKSIKISKDIGHKQNEARSLSYLGKVFYTLGKVKESVHTLEEALRISEQIGDVSMAASILLLLGAKHHYQKSLRFSQQIHDREKEGKAYCHLGTALAQLQEYDEAIKYLEKALEISNLTGNKVAKEEVCLAFVDIHLSLGQHDKVAEYTRKAMESISEAGTREDKRSSALIRVAARCATAGNIQQTCDVLAEGLGFYEQECEPLSDEHKLSVGDKSQSIAGYKSHCGVMIALGRILDALCTAERGRARVLRELLAKKYAIQEKVDFNQDSLGYIIGSLTKEQILVFTAVLHNVTVFWKMTNEEELKLKITSRKESCENDVHDFLENILHGNFRSLAGDRDIECEDRSLSEFYDPGSSDDDKEVGRNKGERLVESDDEEDKVTKTPNQLYHMLIAPFADITDIEGREVVLVPEGSMFMVPFASLQNDSGQYLCDICKIRILPSLTTLKLIYDCPANYHSNAGALIVGDPNVSQVTRLNPLPAARQEAKQIADLLNVTPLLGDQATKEEVLRRITDVCLIHIAAHGDAERGEIACAPNPSFSLVPRKEDFMLTMEDIAKVGIRAKLVVLSCCHSGRGKVMKSEGVVGIARAFIASGARSVLVSLWLLNDESTKEFMIRFYMHLVCDKLSASEALHQAIKWMRQSENYNDVRDWAPFVLIGDDVRLDFKGLAGCSFSGKCTKDGLASSLHNLNIN